MARTLLISGGICFACFVGIGVTAKPTGQDRLPDRAVAVGGTTVLDISTKYVCLQNHHRVANAGTTLTLEDGTEIDCETLPISNKPWQDEISTTTWAYRGKEVVETGHKQLKLKLRVSIPDLPELVGQTGKLVASGSVIYPYAPKGSKSFEDRAGDFSVTRPVSLVTREQAEDRPKQPPITTMFSLIFGLSLLTFMGTVIVRFFRRVFG